MSQKITPQVGLGLKKSCMHPQTLRHTHKRISLSLGVNSFRATYLVEADVLKFLSLMRVPLTQKHSFKNYIKKAEA